MKVKAVTTEGNAAVSPTSLSYSPSRALKTSTVSRYVIGLVIALWPALLRLAKALLDHLLNVCMWLEDMDYEEREK